MSCSYYASPRWSWEICDCSMPLTFDSYSKCAYGCVYCFSAYQRAVGASRDSYLKGKPKPVNVERVKRIFSEPEFAPQYSGYIGRRLMMQWGGLSDPFCWYEKRMGVGLELIRFFSEIDYPLSFSTKGTWWTLDDRYREVFEGRKNWHVKVSIVTLDKQKSRKVEYCVPSPQKRIEAIGRIAKMGIAGVTLRLRPFLFGITDPHHKEMIKLAADAGADSVSTEFFCLETRSSTACSAGYSVLSDVSGMDYVEFYRRNSRGSGYLRLNRNLKRRFVDEMGEACDKAGIRFYVSDAHFKERCHGYSCCGVPDHLNFSRDHFTTALLLCKQNGTVSWPEISEGLGWANFSARKHGSLLQSTELRAEYWDHTMYDMIRHIWNNPTGGHSPYRYFCGLMRPDRLDENGDIVYVYDKTRE